LPPLQLSPWRASFHKNAAHRNLSAILAVYLIGNTPAENPVKALKKEADERLLVEPAQRDPSRFAELYEQNFERVYAFILRRVKERSQAEDLTSEVFHQALRNFGRYQWRGVPFAAWLLRIARNAIVDNLHKSNREQELTADEASDESSEMAGVEQRATLFRLVSTLPADQKRVIRMRFAEEKSIREIATAIGRSEGAVKQLQFRALQKLRAQVEGARA
jgi:RNA polymerase sigma-70 factor, ECF subfamily